MNVNELIAIDVHLETEIDDNAANEAANEYSGDSTVGRNRYELAAGAPQEQGRRPQ